ncbi:MAG: prolyl oligopeptidase family serine peptidase [Planctomycetes bacterium]|nr:prolyl oligopeptidase family serine peptidase [Planctomycetota bacterium]
MTVGLPARLMLMTVGLAAAAACAADSAPQADTSWPKLIGRCPFVFIPKGTAPEKLAGDLSAEAWKQAAKLDLNECETGKALPYKSEALVFCTPDALFVGFRCEEPKPDELVTKGEIWTRDEVEVFLEPQEDLAGKPYHQLMLDSTGAFEAARHHVYPLAFMRQKFAAEAWKPKLEIATAKNVSGWTCEVRIPFAELKGTPTTGAFWRLNVGRCRPARGADSGMAWSWSVLGTKSFHSAQRFGFALLETLAKEDSPAEARKRAPSEADLEWLKGPDEAFLAEANKLAEALGSAAAAERAKAEKALVGLPGKRLSASAALVQVLRCAWAKYRNDDAQAEALAAVLRLQDALTAWPLEHPDDPPPAEVLHAIDAFEPRVQKDAEGKALGYRLLKPKDFNPEKKYPLLVYLHGSGECGSDNRSQIADVFFLSEGAYRGKYNAFVLAPQCPKGARWADFDTAPEALELVRTTSNYRLAAKPSDPMRLLLDAVDALQKEFPAIDGSRLYIVGSSLGGFGTWEALVRRPGFFAAAVPICGGNDETQAERAAKTPLWIFHGAKDQNVKVAGDRNMVAALKKIGVAPKYTEYPEAGHSIHPFGSEPELFDWIFAQQKK